MEPSLRVAEVPAGRGGAWLADSFLLFRKAPFAWIGLCAGWIIVTFGLMILPLIGTPLASFLQPAFFASFALAARKQEGGGMPVMGDLFVGFRRNFRALVFLGAILSLLQIAILAFMVLLGLPTGTPDQAVTIVEFVEMLKGKEWILAVGLLLTALAKGALWFAPPLLALHEGMSVSHAIRWSVYAALANFGAMLVYGALSVMLFVVAMLPWGLGLLVAIPMMSISTYLGYREVFEKAEKPLADAA